MVSLCIICIGISSGCCSSLFVPLNLFIYSCIFHVFLAPIWMFLVRFIKLFSMFLKATTTTYTNEANECYCEQKKSYEYFWFYCIQWMETVFFMVYEVKQWNINGFVHVCGIIVLVYQSLYINCPNTLSLYSAQL